MLKVYYCTTFISVDVTCNEYFISFFVFIRYVRRISDYFMPYLNRIYEVKEKNSFLNVLLLLLIFYRNCFQMKTERNTSASYTLHYKIFIRVQVFKTKAEKKIQIRLMKSAEKKPAFTTKFPSDTAVAAF